MKPPTMPLSTVAVLNKVSFVDLVTIPELRKFDFLTSKRTNNQSQEWQKSLVSGELALVHGATGATGLAAVQVFNVLHMLKLFVFFHGKFSCHNATSITLVVLGARSWCDRNGRQRRETGSGEAASSRKRKVWTCVAFIWPRSVHCLALSLTH